MGGGGGGGGGGGDSDLHTSIRTKEQPVLVTAYPVSDGGLLFSTRKEEVQRGGLKREPKRATKMCSALE